MTGFHQFFMIVFLEFNYTGPKYIRWWMGGRGVGVGGWWQKLKQSSKMTQIVEFRVAMMCTYIHKGPVFHYNYKACTDMH